MKNLGCMHWNKRQSARTIFLGLHFPYHLRFFSFGVVLSYRDNLRIAFYHKSVTRKLITLKLNTQTACLLRVSSFLAFIWSCFFSLLLTTLFPTASSPFCHFQKIVFGMFVNPRQNWFVSSSSKHSRLDPFVSWCSVWPETHYCQLMLKLARLQQIFSQVVKNVEGHYTGFTVN